MGYAIIINNHMSFAKNNLGQVHLSEYDNMNIFNIKAITDITIRFTNNFEYNSGASFYWNQYKANTELELGAGLDLMIRSELIPTSENGIGTFDIDGEFSISGDITYLLNDNELTAYAFKNLFNGCDTLMDASELSLPDTTEQSCYEAMFKNCTSIEKSPILPAISLSTDCYKEMFYGCSSLNEITIKSEDSLGENYSYNWVYGVAEEGMFKPVTGIEHETGVHGCPTNWECSADYINMYFTIESLKDSNVIKMQRKGTPNNPTLSYSLDDGETWTTTIISGTVTFGTINTGDKIIFKGNNAKYASDWNAYNYFTADKQFKVYGNVMSMFNGDDFKTNYEFDNSVTHHCAGLFRTTHLVDASNLILSASTLYTSSYNGMFRGATDLQHGPQMLATTPTGKECCSSMFEECINLEEAININFTTLTQQCCMRMFCMNRSSKITTPKMTKSPILRAQQAATDCYKEIFVGNGNLNEITCLITSTGIDCTSNWVKNVGNGTGTFYKNKYKTDWAYNATAGVPIGWTVEDYVE